jgi:RimJ/RimL family protein N-acetyltransferase
MQHDIRLRDVIVDDLPIFFENQRDPLACHMAAFTAKDPQDRAAFDAHWAKIMADESILIKTILVDGQVIGSVLSFVMFGEPDVAYWIHREYWGKGITTAALTQFLEIQKLRPLYARAAKDNLASIRVLEKCGFKPMGSDKGFANARGEEIEEVILELSAVLSNNIHAINE